MRNYKKYIKRAIGLGAIEAKTIPVMKKRLYAFILFILLAYPVWGVEKDQIAQHLSILPVFFVPHGETEPNSTHIEMVKRHLKITQQYYKTMLKERDTFSIADLEPQVLHDRTPLARLKEMEGKNRTKYLLGRLFNHFEINRFNCPYVFLVVIMCPDEPWPTASGRPINDGFNGGGGIAVFSSNKLDEAIPLIQGSFQHELGHAFGLVHVDSYGYDQYKNKSIMSYNKENYWSGYNPPKEPGILIPEDIRALSMNRRVFPNLFFDSKSDIPEGYKIGKWVRLTFDSIIPGQESYVIKVTSASGQANDTNPGNIVLGYIRPNQKSEHGIGLISNQMWMSEKSRDEWVYLELEFPLAVRMNRIRVYSQCGGGLYPLKAVRVEAKVENFEEIAKIDNTASDETDVRFKAVKSKQWRLCLKPDLSGQVVIRGLRFFFPEREIFCPKIPTYLTSRQSWPIY
jgi:hypothetical protein